MEKENISKNINYLLVLLASTSIIIVIGLYFLIENIDFNLSIKNLILQVLPNFLAVLLAFLIVNYFLNRKGISTTKSLTNEIVTSLYQELNKQKILEKEEANANFNLKEKLETAQTLDIVAFSAINLLNTYRDNLVKSISKGSKIRVIRVKNHSSAAKVIMENSRMKGLEKDLERTDKILEFANDEIIKIDNTLLENFKTRKIEWIPSCSMIIYNRNEKDASIKLTVNHLHLSTPISHRSMNFIITRTLNPDWFDYLVSQYERLWEKGN